MKRNLLIEFIIILVVLAGAFYFSYPPFDTPSQKGKLNLGLDLKGGVHLVWEVDKEKLNQMGLSTLMRQDSIYRAVEVIRNRIDALGVKEPTIYTQGNDRVVVQLPGLDDPNEAIKTIGDVAFLEFRLVNDDPQKLTEATNGKVPLGWELKNEVNINERGETEETPMLVKAKPALTGELLKSAYVTTSSGFGMPEVGLEFTREGAKRFAKVTSENVGKRLAILLDDKIISAPSIRSAISGGRAVIQGRFTNEEAQRLSRQLSGGALPVPMKLIDNRSISPSLGSDSIKKGVTAAIIGFAAVVVFMAIYYLISGLVADFALCMNLLIITGVMSLFGFTLTLPGIAGIILTMGMAVDANVLINERIREEILLGKTFHSAMEAGFKRAFLTIFDSNITTLITAAFLFQFGTGPIKGFAVTLTTGILASLFTAVFVVHVLIRILVEKFELNQLKMLQIFGKTNINFVGIIKKWVLVSIILIVVGMGWFVIRGNKNFGIDFTGGTLLQFSVQKPLSLDPIRTELKKIGEGTATIQHYGEDNEILIKTESGSTEKIYETLKEKFSDYGIKRERTEYVGPAIGAELRQRAFLALLFSLGGLLIYISWRFEFRFALGAILALIHDVLITMGIYAISGREISITYVAAMLTMVGYSINDTIVVYDRIRENMSSQKKLNMPSIVNLSINQTISRTILTGLTTLLVLVALYFFGGEVLNDFAFILIVGIITGTYSSVFIASPVVLFMEKTKKA